MANKDGQNWYQRNGVEPPEHIPHGVEEDITEKMKGTVHGAWQQRGNRLICTKCPNHHMTDPIPIDRILTGTDNNGLPILKKLAIPKA